VFVEAEEKSGRERATVSAGADIVNDVSGGLDLYATAPAAAGESGNGADAAAADAADVADAGGGQSGVCVWESRETRRSVASGAATRP